MATRPEVSVLLPAFNAGATLGACLRSVERQSLRSWECILVDDGSTDATADSARAFAKRDERMRVVGSTRRGLVRALNAGLAECRGRLVARMDADDLMHRDRLAAQVAALAARPEWTAVGSHVRLFPRGRLGPGYRAYEEWINGIDSPRAVRREAFVECPVAHPTLMVRRRPLVELEYRDLGWPEDYDLVLRLLAGGAEIGMVPRRLVAWRHGPQRLSVNDPAYAADRFAACKAHFLAGSFLGSTERYLLWGYGGTGRALCRALRAEGRRPSHIIEVHPGRLGNRIHGAPVVSPAELAGLPRLPLIVSVAGRGPRSEVRRWLVSRGLIETRDFVCAA